ncbi:MAG TPA: DUF748 domain-containing protein [Nitrospiria bacterium]|nr:DUF748 domain-containing protein [Nitrospiria bacterium]
MNLPALARHPITRRLLIRSAAGLAAYAVIGFLILPPIVRSLLVSQLSQKLHRTVRLEKVRINPFALSVEIDGLSISERGSIGPFVSFRELYVNLDSASLIKGGLVLSEIRVDEPRLTLVRNEDLSYNFSDLLHAPPGAQPAAPSKPFRFSLNNIQILNGSLDFEDRPKHAQHSIHNLRVAIPFLSNLPSVVEIFVQPAFQAEVNGTPVSLTGKSKPFSDSLDTSVELNVTQLDLAHYADYVPVELPFRLRSGILDTALTITFIQSRDRAPRITVAGTIGMKQLGIDGPSAHPMFDLGALQVAITSADLTSRELRFGAIQLDGPVIWASRDAAGRTTLGLLAGAPNGGGGGSAPSPAVSPQAAASVPAGTVDVDSIRVTDARLTVAAGRAGATEKNEEWVRIPGASITRAGIDLGRRSVTIDRIDTQGGVILVRRERNGELNLASLAPRPSSARPPHPPAGQAADAPWIVTLNHFLLDHYAIRFDDLRPSSPARLTADPIRFSADGLSTAKDHPGTVSLSIGLNKSGFFTAEGKVGIEPLTADLSIDLTRVALAPFQPYVADRANIIVAGGELSVVGRVKLETTKEQALTARFDGETSLRRLAVLDQANSEEVVGLGLLQVKGIHAGFQPLRVEVGTIALTDVRSRLAVNPDGKLNLLTMLKSGPAPDGEIKPASAPAVQAPSPPQSQRPPPIRIERVTLSRAAFEFADRSIQPQYVVTLTDLGGTVSGLSSQMDQRATVDISGKIDGIAPLTVSGTINPLSRDVYADLLVQLKELELSPLTPYSGKYAGYAIQKGKLSLDFKYLLQQRMVKADNTFFIDQFTFGEKVDSPEATNLPVRLAVSLLTDRNGAIRLDIPVEGSLDDPQFRVWRAVLHVVQTLLVKAATSPFALVSALAGGEELNHIDFQAGSSGLDGPSRERVNAVEKILYDRPALKLEITGRVDPVKDREALHRAKFLRLLKVQKFNELIKQGASVGSVDDVTITPEEYPKYLAMAYKKESFPKPRNFFGIAKELPAPEMERLMLEHLEVSGDELRQLASRRALRVKEAIVSSGQVEPERLFLAEAGTAQAAANGGLLSRVDLSIR